MTIHHLTGAMRNLYSYVRPLLSKWTWFLETTEFHLKTGKGRLFFTSTWFETRHLHESSYRSKSSGSKTPRDLKQFMCFNSKSTWASKRLIKICILYHESCIMYHTSLFGSICYLKIECFVNSGKQPRLGKCI